MVELQTTRSVLVEHQQSEMVQQLLKHRAQRLSKLSLYDLDAATHELTVNVGKTLRREGLQRKNILVLDTGRNHLPRARPITHSRDRFNLACRNLASEDAVPATVAAASRRHRDRLTQTLREPPRIDRGPTLSTST
jgi:hypothetical protein